MNKNRYTTIDVIRGFAVVSMIIYHTVWDLVYIFNVNLPFYRSNGAHIWQQSILWTFVIISGFCVNMGRKKLKRAVTVIICSTVISLATYIFMPRNLILFGVLTFLGFAMLITSLTDNTLSKIPPFLGLVISFLLFVFTRNISEGVIFFSVALPDILYCNNLTAFLGFPPPSFVSQDYVPLLPWIFLFLCGYFLNQSFRKTEHLKILSLLKCRPLEFFGRYSLQIYMLHQPLIYGILLVLFKAFSV